MLEKAKHQNQQLQQASARIEAQQQASKASSCGDEPNTPAIPDGVNTTQEALDNAQVAVNKYQKDMKNFTWCLQQQGISPQTLQQKRRLISQTNESLGAAQKAFKKAEKSRLASTLQGMMAN